MFNENKYSLVFHAGLSLVLCFKGKQENLTNFGVKKGKHILSQ